LTRSKDGRPILVEDRLSVGAYEPGETTTYWDADGHELARVMPVDDDRSPLIQFAKDEVIRELGEVIDVRDRYGVVFSLHRYEAADHPSYDVVGEDDRVLGTSTPTPRSPRRSLSCLPSAASCSSSSG
jgi:hypothetical protein